jgi:NTE family protein
MSFFPQYTARFFSRKHPHNVALVLGGGGARGFAHIGAIEVLTEHGYTISSISGTSMGALVGGLYAAGKLNELKGQLRSLNRKQLVSLIDISIGLDHIATGKRLTHLIEQLTGGIMIEDLPIPFCCIASDIVTGKEKVFSSGPLSLAIRASISIPCFFSSVHHGDHIYIDGSVHNTLPLDRVARTKHDLLVAVNASAPDSDIYTTFRNERKQSSGITSGKLRKMFPKMNIQFSENYMNLALRTARLSIQANTQMAMKLNPPDICVDVPMNMFDVFDFEKSKTIIEFGRQAMEKQITAFEKK